MISIVSSSSSFASLSLFVLGGNLSCFVIAFVRCRPILVLPPADIQVIYCERTEAERDFYDALFKRSKVSYLC